MSQRLGEILLAHGSIDPGQLQAALAYQRERGRLLGDALLELRYCNQGQVLAGLAAQAGLPPIDLDREMPDRTLAGLMSRADAERFRAVPLRQEAGTGVLTVAVAPPATQEQLEELREATGARALRLFIATGEAVTRAIARLYTPRRTSLPTILLYGWPEDAAETLMSGLAERQIPSRQVSATEALAAGTRDILLAPIPAMEALLGRERCSSLLIAAAKHAEDFPRAEKLDACGFLLAPLDMDCVVRAIQRCHQLLGISLRQAMA